MLRIPENTIADINNFNNVVNDYKNGIIDLAQFKPFLAITGIYEERTLNSYMIRARIPSGVITLEQFEEISKIAKEYSYGRIHFTTRQDIQFHKVNFDDLSKIIERFLKVGLISKGTGGSAPRNVAVDPLSGVAKDNVFDPTPYALATAEYLLKYDNNYKLPRKYKIAFSSSFDDRGLAKISDLGFISKVKDGKKGFVVYGGGGLGGAARPSLLLNEFIEAHESLYYVEAMRLFFFEQGDRTNRAKARIRHLVYKLGEDGFKKEFYRYLEIIKSEKRVSNEEFSHYSFEYNTSEGKVVDLLPNTTESNVKGRYNLYVHPVNGHLKVEALDKINTWIRKLEYLVSIRLTNTQGFIIREIDGKDLQEIYDIVKEISSPYVIDKIAACTGASTCKLGIGLSQGLSVAIIEFFKDKSEEIKNSLPVINISGCPNSCGQHQIGKIGLTGKAKKTGEYFIPTYSILLGGDLKGEFAQFGKEYGDVPAKAIPPFLFELAQLKNSLGYTNTLNDFYRFITEQESEIKTLIQKHNNIPSVEDNPDFYKDFGQSDFFFKKG